MNVFMVEVVLSARKVVKRGCHMVVMRRRGIRKHGDENEEGGAVKRRERV